MSAGKGDSPRNNFSREFRDNFDRINWKKQEQTSWNKFIFNLMKEIEEEHFVSQKNFFKHWEKQR